MRHLRKSYTHVCPSLNMMTNGTRVPRWLILALVFAIKILDLYSNSRKVPPRTPTWWHAMMLHAYMLLSRTCQRLRTFRQGTCPSWNMFELDHVYVPISQIVVPTLTTLQYNHGGHMFSEIGSPFLVGTTTSVQEMQCQRLSLATPKSRDVPHRKNQLAASSLPNWIYKPWPI